MKKKREIIELPWHLTKEEIEKGYEALSPGDQYEIDMQTTRLIKAIKSRAPSTVSKAKVAFGPAQAHELLVKLGIFLAKNPIPDGHLLAAGMIASDFEIRRLGPQMPYADREEA
jgi:hypothetical protein